jgi:hypothetical protein
MRGLCYHYGVEHHNFAPNAILQASTFISVREGFLGIPVNCDFWDHLFCAEQHTVATTETRVRRAVRTGGFGSRQPISPVDRPPHGEEASHLRDDRGCRPYGAGMLAAVARAFSSGVRGDEGEARGQP